MQTSTYIPLSLYIYIYIHIHTYMHTCIICIYIYIYIYICGKVGKARMCLSCSSLVSFTLLGLRVSSLRRGHAKLLCIVPIITDVPRRESNAASLT